MSSKIPPPPPPPTEHASSNISSADYTGFVNTTINRNNSLINSDYGSPLIKMNLYSKYVVVDLKPILQTGPNCGLAALAMAATVTPCSLNLVDFCNKAKSRGFSNNGEMFSVTNMATLAEATLSPWFKVEMFSGGLADHQRLIIRRLQDGDLILVPYDADKNHYPCCKKGHKAHWAILCGVFEGKDGCMYVAARQGKSRHLAVWSFVDLEVSNSNLCELDPDREQDNKEYIIPRGGLTEGLARRFIILHPC